MEKVELTVRDIQLIEYIGKYGVVDADSTGKHIYNDALSYYKKRLVVLNKSSYIKRCSGTLYLGSKGKKYLEERGKEIRVIPKTKRLKERCAAITKFMNQTSESWVFMPSWEVKKWTEENYEKRLDKGGRYYGIIKSWTRYVVYNIGDNPSERSVIGEESEYEKRRKHRPKNGELTCIAKEMHKLNEIINIDKAIVFVESKSAFNKYIKFIRKYNDGAVRLWLQEHLLLPYTDYYIGLLNNHGKHDLIKAAAEHIYGNIQAPLWTGADYTVENGKQLIVMLFNDLVKMQKLENELLIRSYGNRITMKFVILCLEQQKTLYTEIFPQCEIKTISQEEAYKL